MRTIGLALVVLSGMLMASTTHAQQSLRRTAGRTYQPTYPLYSPYLMMFGNDYSFAQRFFFFVNPVEQNRAFLAEQQYRINQLEIAPRSYDERMRVTADEAADRGLRTERRRGVGSPATVGGFNDTMHFYPARSPARR